MNIDQLFLDHRIDNPRQYSASPADIDSLPVAIRNKIRVDPQTGCWVWVGAIQSRGYGSFVIAGKSWLTHRLVYSIMVGRIPDGLQNDHLCKNKPCCNPEHLEPVTQLENIRRAFAATKTECVKGHPLDGDNLIIKARPDGSKIRNCRLCKNAAQKAGRERAKAAGIKATRRPLEPDSPKHGTVSGYHNHKCRCDACREAARRYQSDRRAAS